MKNVTIQEIAKELKLSPSTVSRALRKDYTNLSKETVQLVIETAKRMGYKRNEMAANLRRKRTGTIGIIVPESVNYFFMEFITHAQKMLRKNGYRVSFAQCNEDADEERTNLQMMLDHQVEGIILCACHNTKNIDVYKQLLEASIPLVFFDRTVDGIPVSRVKIDDYMRAFFMVEHLIRRGRKRIIHLAGPSYIQNTHERIRAYRDALEKFHLPFRCIVESGVSMDTGEKSMEGFLRKEIPFDAVFCFTENAALGAKRSLQRNRIRIPDDVAICCVSGTDLSTLVHPTMTAIEQPVQLMAQKSVELMLEKLKNPDTPCREIVLESKMFIRESTGGQK